MRLLSLHHDGGPVPYERARELQLKLVELRAADLIPDTILFLEHLPVITRGRGLQFNPAADPSRPKQMPLPVSVPEGVAVCETERGGDLTFHEPGQLVVYPICRLGSESGFAPEKDVTRFLRSFESVIVQALGDLGVEAGTKEHETGVWTSRGKVASMGIAVRKWVTYHGIAVNAVNTMGGFRLISPCGYSPETMVRLADLLPGESPAAPIFAAAALPNGERARTAGETPDLCGDAPAPWRELLERLIAKRIGEKVSLSPAEQGVAARRWIPRWISMDEALTDGTAEGSVLNRKNADQTRQPLESS